MLKRSAFVGSVVLAAGILIGWMGGLFLPGGGGAGDGESESESVGVADLDRVQVTSPQPSADAPEEQDDSATTVSQHSERPAQDEPADVAQVLIDGDEYLVARRIGGELQYQPATLEQVVELAKAADGNEAGIRVRIARRGSAIPVAEEKLDQQLLESDIPREAIFWVDETAP